jgi:hypothetical protein
MGEGLIVDTNGLEDEDDPLIDVCYVSDMLVNMIAADAQQPGAHAQGLS